MILAKLFVVLILKINFLSFQILAINFGVNYDQKFSKLLYILSADGYSTNPGKCMPMIVPEFKDYRFIQNFKYKCDKSNNNCTAYLLANRNRKTRTAILVFTGSESFSQIRNIFGAMRKKGVDFFGLGKVNPYFVNAHRILWKHIERYLHDCALKGYKFIVTGHSLGGGLAALAALRLQMDKITDSNNIIVYTYGEPRIGSLQFAKNFDKLIPQCFRVVYGRDFIPRMPDCVREESKSLIKRTRCSTKDLEGTYHHGQEIWYPKNLNSTSTSPYIYYIRFPEPKNSNSPDYYRICSGEPKNEDFECSNSVTLEALNFKEHKAHHSQYHMDVQKQYPEVIANKLDNNCKLRIEE